MGAIMPVVTLNMIRIDRRRRESLQLQLYGQIRRAIMSGELSAGARLPSTRDLVEQLDLSRNTIVYAFERLVAEGYLEGRVGSGMYVADLPAVSKPPIIKDVISDVASDGRSRISQRIASLSKVRIAPEYPTSKVRPFRPCQPAVDHFPLRTWNRARSSALRLQAKELMCEGDVAGLPRLRKILSSLQKVL
jgi:GntR family transcriptional regulator / MocR family aminotransferase